MSYTVAKISTPDGVAFTARDDQRTCLDLILQAIRVVEQDLKPSMLYQSIYKHQQCSVTIIQKGLRKNQADNIKKILINYEQLMGNTVLNAK